MLYQVLSSYQSIDPANHPNYLDPLSHNWKPQTQFGYQIFLERLRQARHEDGLTQLDVANLLNKPQSFVSKCESGERRVDFVELLDFAKIFNKSLDFFRP